MDRGEAKRAVEVLKTYADSEGAGELVFHGAKRLSDFHQWANGAPNVGLFQLADEYGAYWLLFCAWSHDAAPDTYHLIVYPSTRSGPILEAHELTDGGLAWRYSPRRRDGRNEGRKVSFAAAMGDTRLRISLPTAAGDVAGFLRRVASIAGAREDADANPATATPTYLLIWDPARWKWPAERIAAQIAQLNAGERVADTWSSGVTKRIHPGDRFVLLRQGDPPRGIFASGRVTSDVYEKPHWDEARAAKGDKNNTVDIEFDELLNPWADPLLDQEELSSAIPDMDWSPQASGAQVPVPAVPVLEERWQAHLREHGGSIRMVHDIGQLRHSMASFQTALSGGDPRTKYAVWPDTYFVFDPSTGNIAPAKWAAIRGMTPEIYVALQHMQRKHASPRGFDGDRAARHLEKLLGSTFEPDDGSLVEQLTGLFEDGFGKDALAKHDLSGVAFMKLPADGEVSTVAPKYWKISPGQNARFWDTWRNEGIASIGWDELGDLSGLAREAFDQRAQEAMGAHPAWTATRLGQVWKLRKLKPGDKIVANRGTSRVVGIGTVTSGYFFEPGVEHGHRVKVEWYDTTEREVEKRGWKRTVIRLSAADFEEIETAPAVGTGIAPEEAAPEPPVELVDYESILATLEDKRLHFSPEVVANYLLALQAKRFVILTGISGTGKTKLALEVARMFDRDAGDEGQSEVPEGAADATVMPYMLKYHRLVVPAELAASFVIETDGGTSGRIPIVLPDGRESSQAYYNRVGTNLLQLLFSGDVRRWFHDTFAEGDTIRIERFEREDQKAAMRVSAPGPSSRKVVPGGRYEVIPVRPDWMDHRGLLGFYNPLTQQYITTPFVDLLLRAAAEARSARDGNRAPRPYFAILDEMNIARVEHYFSDFLSAMESGEPINLHQDALLESGETEQGLAIPRQLRVPENLFFIGTVNVDETTYLFSPKVIDRAFTLEFNDVDLEGYAAEVNEDADEPDYDEQLTLPNFEGAFELSRPPGPADWAAFGELEHGELQSLVVKLNSILASDNRHFGYRVANEIGRFVCLAKKQSQGLPALWAALDLALLQKALPKLHGTQQELEELLQRLFAFGISGEPTPQEQAAQTLAQWSLVGGRLACPTDVDAEPRLPRFALKVRRMLRRLAQQGFTSFIE